MANKFRKPDLDKIEEAINPFVANPHFKIKISIISNYRKDGTATEVELEAQQYTKLFRSSGIRKAITALSPASKSLLFWMLYSVERTRHCIWIDRLRVSRECGMRSHNTLKGAIRELCNRGFMIPTTHQSVFWTNPMIFFCGSRVKKYPKNIDSYDKRPVLKTKNQKPAPVFEENIEEEEEFYSGLHEPSEGGWQEEEPSPRELDRMRPTIPEPKEEQETQGPNTSEFRVTNE